MNVYGYELWRPRVGTCIERYEVSNSQTRQPIRLAQSSNPQLIGQPNRRSYLCRFHQSPPENSILIRNSTILSYSDIVSIYSMTSRRVIDHQDKRVSARTGVWRVSTCVWVSRCHSVVRRMTSVVVTLISWLFSLGYELQSTISKRSSPSTKQSGDQPSRGLRPM